MREKSTKAFKVSNQWPNMNFTWFFQILVCQTTHPLQLLPRCKKPSESLMVSMKPLMPSMPGGWGCDWVWSGKIIGPGRRNPNSGKTSGITSKYPDLEGESTHLAHLMLKCMANFFKTVFFYKSNCCLSWSHIVTPWYGLVHW